MQSITREWVDKAEADLLTAQREPHAQPPTTMRPRLRDATWPSRFPDELGIRLQALLDNPDS